MNHSADIPSFIFDWLDTHSYTSLNAIQQKKVLEYLSMEDYDELHQGIAGIRTVNIQHSSARRTAIKQDLLHKFDEKHKRRAPVFIRPIAFWKVAAVFICIASGWLYTYLIRQKQHVPEPLAHVIDTFYITKEIAVSPSRIFDTVYLEQDPSEPAGKVYPKTLSRPGGRMAAAAPGNLNIVQVKDIENTPNRQKRNSIKDDSLIKKYAFTTL